MPKMARLRFGIFELDERAGSLLERGQPVHLQPKPFALLVLLLRHPGQLFAREALEAHLWPNVYVTEDSLTQVVARLRRVFGSEILQTIPRRGYRLNAEVEALPEAASAAPASALGARLALGDRLIGRDEELAALMSRLQRGEMAVVTGPVGVGRTALLRALLSEARRPGIFVEITPARGLFGAVAAAIGIQIEGAAEDLEQRLRSLALALSERLPLLLVLDDIHHDPDANRIIALLQQHCDGLSLIVSSRERSELPGIALSGLGARAAAALLGARAGIPVDAEDPSIIALIEALDGNPLALSLAAPRLRWMSPGELLARLGGASRFAALEGAGVRLSIAIEEAASALTPEARRALSRLFSIDAEIPMVVAEGMLSDIGALDTLQQLTDSGWLSVRRGEGSWVKLLSNQRAWLAQRGTDEAEILEGARRAVEIFEPLARTYIARYEQVDPDARRWLAENAVALYAVAQKVPSDRSPEMLVRIALVAGDQLGVSYREPLALVESALQHPSLSEPERTNLMLRRGVLLARISPRRAVPVLRQVVERAERGEDLRICAWAWAELALALHEIDPSELLALSIEAERRALASGDPEYIVYARYVRASAARSCGQSVREDLDALVATSAQVSPGTRLLVLSLHATVLQEQGQLPEAEAAIRHLLLVCSPHQRSALLCNLANLLAGRGALEEAEERYCDSIAHASWRGSLRHRLNALLGLARCQIARKKLVEAERHLAEVLAQERSRDLSPLLRSDARCIQGLLALRQGRPQLALHYIETARVDRPVDAVICAMAAIACVRCGALDDADRWYGIAADLPSTFDDEPALALALAHILWARAPSAPDLREHLTKQLALLDRLPGPGIAPLSQRLVEMSWLRPDREAA